MCVRHDEQQSKAVNFWVSILELRQPKRVACFKVPDKLKTERDFKHHLVRSHHFTRQEAEQRGSTMFPKPEAIFSQDLGPQPSGGPPEGVVDVFQSFLEIL